MVERRIGRSGRPWLQTAVLDKVARPRTAPVRSPVGGCGRPRRARKAERTGAGVAGAEAGAGGRAEPAETVAGPLPLARTTPGRHCLCSRSPCSWTIEAGRRLVIAMQGPHVRVARRTVGSALGPQRRPVGQNGHDGTWTTWPGNGNRHCVSCVGCRHPYHSAGPTRCLYTTDRGQGTKALGATAADLRTIPAWAKGPSYGGQNLDLPFF